MHDNNNAAMLNRIATLNHRLKLVEDKIVELTDRLDRLYKVIGVSPHSYNK